MTRRGWTPWSPSSPRSPSVSSTTLGRQAPSKGRHSFFRGIHKVSLRWKQKQKLKPEVKNATKISFLFLEFAQIRKKGDSFNLDLIYFCYTFTSCLLLPHTVSFFSRLFCFWFLRLFFLASFIDFVLKLFFFYNIYIHIYTFL